MTVNERLDDISKRSGMSVDIIRRVLEAERESILESLKRGERATLIGRCVILPEIRQKLTPEGVKRNIRLSSKVISSLETELEGMDRFSDSREEIIDMEGIRMVELSSLGG